jgi:hypothetical protein
MINRKILLICLLLITIGLTAITHFGADDATTELQGVMGLHGFARSLCTLDFNADGYCDLLLIEDKVIYSDTLSGTTTGRINIYLGSGNGLPNLPDLTISAPSVLPDSAHYNGSWFGFVKNIGDFNGDSQPDFIVHRTFPDNSANQDIPYNLDIYYGGVDADTIPDFTFEVDGDSYPMDVSPLKDINGDGCDDLGYTVIKSDGVIEYRIIYGGSGDDHYFMTITNNYGRQMHGVGDINADGYDDFSVEIWPDPGSWYFGDSYIFFGSAELDSIPDIKISDYHNPPFGSLASKAIGDFNGDGYDDCIAYTDGENCHHILFGGPNEVPNISMTGGENYNAYTPTISTDDRMSFGDVNGDGKSDFLCGAGPTRTGLHLLTLGGQNGTRDYALWGESSRRAYMNAMGDFNGDGYDDIVYGGSGDVGCSGRAYVFYCSPQWVEQDPQISTEDHQVPALRPQIRVYPNPSKQNVNIEIKNDSKKNSKYQLKIFNIKGQMVYKQKIKVDNQIAKVNFDYDTLQLKSGVYLVRLYSGNECVGTRKFTIVK